jgi:N-acetyl-gamma-glutamyl-phosphate reductase
VALVSSHPYLQLAAVHSRQSKDDLYQLMPQLAKKKTPVYSMAEINKFSAEIDILLLATPAKISMELVAKLAYTRIIIIDLSGAFRLPENQFAEWYGFSHSAPS